MAGGRLLRNSQLTTHNSQFSSLFKALLDEYADGVNLACDDGCELLQHVCEHGNVFEQNFLHGCARDVHRRERVHVRERSPHEDGHVRVPRSLKRAFL